MLLMKFRQLIEICEIGASAWEWLAIGTKGLWCCAVVASDRGWGVDLLPSTEFSSCFLVRK